MSENQIEGKITELLENRFFNYFLIIKKGADFETAIAATGFGKFNILLLLITIPSAWSMVLEVTSMSYVIPVAECDLNLKLEDKGILNAVTFMGKNRKNRIALYNTEWI